MKNLPLILAVLLLASQAHAVPVILSATRNVTISGFAVGTDGSQNYSQTQTPSSQFAPFSANISDQANWHFIYQDHDWPFPLHAASRALQYSTIGSDFIAVGASAFVETWTPLPAAGGLNPGVIVGDFALATSVFHIDFRFDEPTVIGLGLSREFSPTIGLSMPFSLTALGGELALGFNDLKPVEWVGVGIPRYSYPGVGSFFDQYRYDGVLPAGDYRLIFDATTTASTDPLGMQSSAQLGLSLQFGVPDAGATVVLLGLSMAGLICARHLLTGERAA